MGRRDVWTPPVEWSGQGRASVRRGLRAETFGDEKSTIILSGEITAPRAWPRNDSPDPTATFGEYSIGEQLGTGGMASVHRAERRVKGVRQRVALKRMLPHAAADPDLVKLFLDEARLVSLLRHRNIAEVYDFGTVGEEYFLAMELVAGPTLKQLLRHGAATVGLIPYPIALNLLIQICDALAYAHDRCDEHGKPLRIVHRDVSPSNIVISSNGVVKLIDFGIAKTVSTHTQAGIIKGKLGYIAPEYLEDTGLDRRADLWAVGVVAYEMLCNARLFDADDDFEMMRKVRSEPITPPSTYNHDIPAELESIVMTALQRDPMLRWQNATALRNALAGVAKPSSNAEVMEWVEWVFKLAGETARPVRGSRPITAQPAPRTSAASLVDAKPILPPPLVPSMPTVQLAPVLQTPVPMQRPQTPAPLPLPPEPTPPPVVYQPMRALQLRAPPPLQLRAPRPLQPRWPAVGAAMVMRRRRRRIILPLFLAMLGAFAGALSAPLVYELLAQYFNW
ncbi:MAG TPA: serine/threonine-protein kinase [Kofleriaceae bacterium]|nr:serine/threonine-protein kinase [Kofleriaceae bacterium]